MFFFCAYCVVFVLSAIYCRFLWIVYSWLPFRYSFHLLYTKHHYIYRNQMISKCGELVVGSFLLHSDFLLISTIFINWLMHYFLKYFGHTWWKEYGTIVGLFTLFNLFFYKPDKYEKFSNMKGTLPFVVSC